jgi:hypothetical protein
MVMVLITAPAIIPTGMVVGDGAVAGVGAAVGVGVVAGMEVGAAAGMEVGTVVGGTGNPLRSQLKKEFAPECLARELFFEGTRQLGASMCPSLEV